MDCNKTSELISEYIDGVLDAETEGKVKRHIEVCQRCREEYQLLMSIIDECHQIDEIDLPEDFHQKLHQRLVEESKEQKKIKSYGGLRRYYTAAAAALVLFISIGMVINSGVLNMGFQKKSESTAESAEMIMQDTAAPKIAASGMDARQAPEEALAPEERAEMKSAAVQERQFSSNNIEMQQRAMYSVMTVNLSEDEYKKYIKDLGVMIEKMGGFAKSGEPDLYIMPEENMDALMTKIREEYNIDNVIISMEDITERYQQIEQEIAAAADEDASGTENSEESGYKLRSEKEKELNEPEGRLRYMLIQIITHQ